MEIKDVALGKLKEILKEAEKGSCLRIFMTRGCCGSTVAMDIAARPDKEDVEIEKNDFRFYVHKEAAAQLVNATIDCDKNGEIIIKGLPKSGGSCCS